MGSRVVIRFRERDVVAAAERGILVLDPEQRRECRREVGEDSDEDVVWQVLGLHLPHTSREKRGCTGRPREANTRRSDVEAGGQCHNNGRVHVLGGASETTQDSLGREHTGQQILPHGRDGWWEAKSLEGLPFTMHAVVCWVHAPGG